MPQRPSIHRVRLLPCCQVALREINDKLEAGRQLRLALIAGPFVTMFGGNPAEVLFTIASSDWDGLMRATKSVTPIVRNRCMTIAQLHSLDHPGGELNRFWVAMSESFT